MCRLCVTINVSFNKLSEKNKMTDKNILSFKNLNSMLVMHVFNYFLFHDEGFC